MKIFFRLLLIFIFTFFSLGLNNSQAEHFTAFSNHQIFAESASEAVYFNFQPNNDTTIVASNNNGFEFIAQKSGNDNGNFSGGNCCIDNNFYSHYLKIYSDKIINNKSHNISSYLKNEICTRAP